MPGCSAQKKPTAILKIKDINKRELAVLLKYPGFVSLRIGEFETESKEKDEDDESDDSLSDVSVDRHANQMHALPCHRDLLVKGALATTLVGLKNSCIPNKLYWACGLDYTTAYEHGAVDIGGIDLMEAVHERKVIDKVIDMEMPIWEPQ